MFKKILNYSHGDTFIDVHVYCSTMSHSVIYYSLNSFLICLNDAKDIRKGSVITNYSNLILFDKNYIINIK